ncbi:hypothetical protein COL77_30750 [Bacillus wiedmannii]|uniref:hypothetical protein n=1 Tax=Bacillus wiedmannii TaxID=1890302 RepID=UPI000279FE7A|nr:hypothetical protein [Bacillus wiedmannii]EJR08200.1 hypothetical protein II9_05678 [Bacillus cereus MSX-D12]PFZ33012.1 hypothetical protein COL77_30750 [Bacillus wiedmannii]PGM79917.1 hypothetical protein CN957_15705 [Bacillus cereus]
MKTLEKLQGQFFEELKVFMNKQVHFKMSNITYSRYDKGLFKYKAYSEETNEQAVIKLNPYNGEVTACFKSDKEQDWHIGYLPEDK